ncbi:MAG: hypothetical protein IIU08_02685 [Clostridia bacterium]|nr:hypothetical protein [Clostridia bacterium]MBQ5354756.1 hypothetical protein [Clostridia bacterium]
MTEIYRIAEKNIRIVSRHKSVHDLCRDYRFDGEPDFTVETTEADMAFERKKMRQPCSDSYLETLAVYRRIAEIMPRWGTVLVHGSAVAVDGEAYLFTAPSGTGKSTHAALWREVFGERAVMVNDDKPLLHISDGGVLAYGTPWNGKHRLGENIAVPLKAVCFLEQAPSNRIRPLPKPEIYAPLMRQVYRPLDPAALAETMELVGKLADSVGFFRLFCNMEREAAEIAYRGMNGIEPN